MFPKGFKRTQIEDPLFSQKPEIRSFVVDMNENAGDKADDFNNKDTERFFSKVDIL